MSDAPFANGVPVGLLTFFDDFDFSEASSFCSDFDLDVTDMVPGCPRNTVTDLECSNHGECDSEDQSCDCKAGWFGYACHLPDCPGEPDCNNHGVCDGSLDEPICVCNGPWIGPACNDPCVNGTPINSSTCNCYPGFVGLGCDSECSGHGVVRNNTCHCFYEQGWKGTYCDNPGCPGLYNLDCSGRGECNSEADVPCTCYGGWRGIGCESPDCPGTPDCSSNGICSDNVDFFNKESPVCICNATFFGDDCGTKCENGQLINGTCTCFSGWAGLQCDAECSLHGKIGDDGKCICDVKWRGSLCDQPGCPGKDLDCSGHGECNTGTGECVCTNGWTGKGCELPDCPGNPDCSNRGTCDSANYNPPLCVNCKPGWMGPACDEECTNGNQTTPNSGICQCELCWSGKGCNVQCSGHGTCNEGVCKCDDTRRGTLCEVPACPGTDVDCNGHGVCNAADAQCTCLPGWSGLACNKADCTNNCSGHGYCNATGELPVCDCYDGWMTIDCSKACIHGSVEDNTRCICDPCFAGAECDLECSGEGVCKNGLRECNNHPGNAYKGNVCQDPSCPSNVDDLVCSLHGITKTCQCYGGFKGHDCSLKSCPGTPECSDKGTCSDGGKCECDDGWIGDYCQIQCIYGKSVNRICECESCYSGISCQLTCAGNGRCDNGTCICDFDKGFKGDRCDKVGCPGWPENCMGNTHGTCNSATGQCQCLSLWKGNGCHVPICEKEDCSGVVGAYCGEPAVGDTPRCLNCSKSTMGDGCELSCIHGTSSRLQNNIWQCECDQCYSGPDCASECNAHGTCDKDKRQCVCDWSNGYYGERCEEKTCKAFTGEKECSGHGSCITGQCECDTGWTGDGCDQGICQNNCSDRGVCEVDIKQPMPQCKCFHGYYGIFCEVSCQNGVWNHNNAFCDCSPCYSGIDCVTECSNNGNCSNDVCKCVQPYQGMKCEQEGCPGFNGIDCSGHGTCNYATHSCSCNNGWKGGGCDIGNCLDDCNNRGVCNTSLTIPSCTNCDKGWIGMSCGDVCNGTQEPMDSGICVCDSPCQHGDSCELICNNKGHCIEDKCVCATNLTTGYNDNGYWGDHCDVQLCQGRGKSCSGKGSCNKVSKRCTCEERFSGDGCENTDCPGTPDCSGNGVCNEDAICECSAGWMGLACDLHCEHGNASLIGQNTYICECFPCYSGTACDKLCNNYGSCDKGTCTCQTAWWGIFCTEEGCPGLGESCSGQGDCMRSEADSPMRCVCNNRFQGDGCEELRCTDDCNSKGTCIDTYNGVYLAENKCTNCTNNTIGPFCEKSCVHGQEKAAFSMDCVCDPCYGGWYCDVECSSAGHCAYGRCKCQDGYKGDICEQLDCPGEPDCGNHGTCTRDRGTNTSNCICNGGFEGEDCSILKCQQDCNNHGNCTLPTGSQTPTCDCFHGFKGDGCEMCKEHFKEPGCDTCVKNYIGYNHDECNILCFQGYAAEIDGQTTCVCYDDSVNGHWIGQTCQVCKIGWALPKCTECLPNYVGKDDCNIECNNGVYADRYDGDIQPLSVPVIPLFNCYETNADGSKTFWFGYNNTNKENVYITSSNENFLSKDVFFKKPPKVTMFKPGIFNSAFSVRPLAVSDSTEVKWTLTTTKANAGARVAMSVQDSRHKCVVPMSVGLTTEQTGYCKCSTGYYGAECDQKCPGGATKTCNGNGICDPTNGTCLCFISASSNDNCKTCKTGFMGTDCSISFLNQNIQPIRPRGLCYSSGMFGTFDGSIFRCHRQGEYLLSQLSLSTGLSVSIHVLQVVSSCQYTSTSTEAVAVLTGGHKFVVSARHSNEFGAYTWLDGQAVLVGSDLEVASGLICSRISVIQIRCIGLMEMGVLITIHDSHVDVIVEMDKARCVASKGLLSSCDNDQWNDFRLRNNTVLTGNSLDQTAIHYTYAASWEVDISDSAFTSGTGFQIEVPSLGGYGLHISESNFVSSVINTFIDADITYEVKFNCDEVSGIHTIWSYNSNNAIFSVLVKEGVIVIYYTVAENYRTFRTLKVEINKWFHLSLVWSYESRKLNLYLLNEQDKTYVSDFTIYEREFGSSCSIPGGTLMLGQWNQQTSKSSVGIAWNFKGYIDDVRIWKKKLTLTQSREQAFKLIQADSQSLTNWWMFNEGFGGTSIDIISGNIMSSPKPPNPQPVWKVMDYTIETTTDTINRMYKLYNNAENVDSQFEIFCRTHLLDSVGFTACLSQDSSVMKSFYQQCIFNGIVHKSVEASMITLFALPDYCGLDKMDINWPLRTLCNSFPSRNNFPFWKTDTCDKLCDSGTWSKEDNKCACSYGFYGSICNNTCLYALGKPCGGGICNMDNGTCICANNLDSSKSCQQCLPGFVGKDCSSVLVNIPSTSDSAICMAYGYSHFVMFDGQTYSLPEGAEFNFLSTPDIDIYIRQEPCGGYDGYCTKQVWVQANINNFTVVVPRIKDEKYQLFKNGILTTFDSELDLTNSVKIKWKNKKSMLVKFGMSSVNLLLEKRLISVIANLGRATYGSKTSGLCGNFDNNVDNDFFISNGTAVAQSNLTAEIIVSEFAKYFKVPLSQSTGFNYKYGDFILPRNLQGDGYSLFFNGSGAYSSKLKNVFSERGDGTLQLKFNAYANEGLIASYSHSTSMIVYLSNTLKIRWGNQIIDTNFTINLNVWYDISISYSSVANKVTIYIFHDGQLERSVNIPVLLSDIFRSSGLLHIANWLNVPDNIPHFVGQVDEVKIWNIALTSQLALLSSQKRLDVSYYPELTALFPFIGGLSSRAKDIVSGHLLAFPDEGVFWWPSDLVLDGIYTSPMTDPVLKKAASDQCEKMILDGAIKKSCIGLGDETSRFYKEICEEDIIHTGETSAYIYAISTYVELCNVIVNPTKPVQEEICENTYFDDYLKLCTYKCKFGYLSYSKDCTCERGYWKSDCSEVCPGGVEAPCSNNGVCDQTKGICVCQSTYSSLTNCTTCIDGWTGARCDVFQPPSTDFSTIAPVPGRTYNYTFTLFTMAHIRTFRNNMFNFVYVGNFFIVRSSSSNIPTIQVRTTYCYSSSVCVEAVALKYQNSTVLIRSGYTTAQIYILWINGDRYKFNETLSKSVTSLKIIHKSATEIEVTTTSGAYASLHVRITNRYLSFTLNMDSSLCVSQSSIAGNCDTTTAQQLDTFKQEWIVPDSNNLLENLFKDSEYGETMKISTAGYCLMFLNSGISTNFLPDILRHDQDFTLDLFMRPKHFEGNLLNHFQTTLFSVYLDTTLKLLVDEQQHDTRFSVELSKWHHILLVWKHLSYEIDFYLYVSGSGVKVKSFTLTSTTIFNNYGYLEFGKPFDIFSTKVTQAYQKYFTGEIDEIRIWKRALSYLEVSKFIINRLTVEQYSTTDIVSHWKFDEGEGVVVKDSVGTNHIHVLDYGTLMDNVKWQISTLELPTPSPNFSHMFVNVTTQKDIEAKCHEFVYSSAFKTCGQNVPGFQKFSYFACVNDIAGADDEDLALDIILVYADFCEFVQGLDWSPRNKLCNSFGNLSFPGVIDENCDTPCIFSDDTVVSNHCQCKKGYWGKTCDRICPGGVDKPCFNRGICNKETGKCECQINTEGKECDQCVSGWHGETCSVNVQLLPSPSNTYYTGFSSNGHLTLIDGASIIFDKYGIFTYFKTPDVVIEILTGPCRDYHRSISRIAIKVPSNKIVIFTALEKKNVFIQGIATDVITNIQLTPSYTLVRTYVAGYTVIGSGFQMLVIVNQGYLNLQLRLATAVCSISEGIAGFCESTHSCETNDLKCLFDNLGIAKTSMNKNVSNSAISEYFNKFLVSYSDSLLTAIGDTSAGFSVEIIRKGWMSSDALFEEFWSNQQAVTIELLVYIKEIDNTSETIVLSYGVTSTVDIIIRNGTFYLKYGITSVDTTLNVYTAQWTQISLVYDRTTGQILFHYIYSNTKSASKEIDIGLDAFPHSGTFVLGDMFIPAGYVEIAPNGIFSGTFDRLLVWERKVSPSDLFLHWRVSISSKLDDLVVGWNFDEGSGRNSQDFVQGLSITLSDNYAMWVLANLKLKKLEKEDTDIPSTLNTADATLQLCKNFILNGTMNERCGNKVPNSLQYFFIACINDINNTDNKNSALDSVLDVAGICKAAADLSENPEKDLCNEFPDREFPKWKGKDCSVKCLFGEVDDITEKCVCTNGFWGQNCDKECDGGYEKPCNNHGVCNADSGKCQCYGNFKGDNHCTTCTAGYRGEACEDIVPQLPIDSPKVCSVRMRKGIITFHQNIVKPAVTGVHDLYIRNKLRVAGYFTMFTKWNGDIFMRMEKLAVTFHNDSFVFMINTTRIIRKKKSWQSLYINKVKTELGPKKIIRYIVRNNNGTCVVNISRPRMKKYEVIISDIGMLMTIIIRKRKISMTMTIADNYSCNTVERGLCGDCIGCTGRNDCEMINSTNMLVDKTTDLYKCVFEMNSELASCDTKNGYDAGNAIFLNSSSVINTDDIITDNYNTIEFFVKTCASPSCYGTILSYAKDTTFCIKWLNGTIQVTYRDVVFDTGFMLEDNVFNQLAIISFAKYVTKRIRIYHYDSSGVMKYVETRYDGNTLFPKDGSLALGRWQIPVGEGDGDQQPVGDHFVGSIDELRIWSRKFTAKEMTSHWNRTYGPGDEKLTALWKFDTGEDEEDLTEPVTGLVTADEIRHNQMKSFPLPFRGGVLVESDAIIPDMRTSSSSSTTNSRLRRKRDLSIDITTFCNKVFKAHSAFAETCLPAGANIQNYYAYECIQSRDEDELEDILLDYSDYCKYILNLDSWPLYILCDESDFQSTYGQYCKPQCMFGEKLADGQCDCFEGYWNASCDSTCPGGATLPCSGFGTCDQTGKCVCPINHQGANDCSVCTTGWLGGNCDIAVNTKTMAHNIAMANLNGYMYNLDGLFFVVRNPAEYVLLEISNNVILQGKLVACNHNFTCMTFCAIRIGDDVNGYMIVTVQAPRTDFTKPIVYINNKSEALDSKLYIKGAIIWRAALESVKLTINANIEVSVRMQGKYLSVKVTIPPLIVTKTTGILSGSGSTNANEKYEHLLRTECPVSKLCNTTSAAQIPSLSSGVAGSITWNNINIIRNFTTDTTLNTARFVVDACDTLFYYPDKTFKEQNLGGYALQFDSSIIYSKEIDLKNVVGSNLTFEFLVKLNNDSEQGGLLFSFSNIKSFFLEHKETIELNYNKVNYNTNITLEMGVWNKIIVCYIGISGQLNLYRIDSSGNICRKIFQLDTEIFDNIGIISFGQWIPPRSGSSEVQPSHLNGFIDDFMIWGITLEPNIIQDAFEIHPQDVSHLLKSLWSFDEGYGYVSTDELQGKIFSLTRSPWIVPVWYPSDMVYKRTTFPDISKIYYLHESDRVIGERTCSVIVNNTLSQLGISCSVMPESTKFAFYLSCLHAHSGTKDINAAYDVIINYAELCESTFGISGIISTFCNNLNYANNINTLCPSKCEFGIEQTDGSCVCSIGYYGDMCTNICPGGSDTACNNHGTCTSAGLCSCDWNWGSSATCDSCSNGMSGPDCQILLVTNLIDLNKDPIAYVTGTSGFMGFDGHLVSLEGLTGIFTIMEITNTFEIEIYQQDCHIGSCVLAVGVSIEDSNLVILSSGSRSLPKIYQNGSKVELSKLSVTSQLMIEIKSFDNIEVIINVPQTTRVNLIMQEYSIDLIVFTKLPVCSQSSGILGKCNEGTSQYEGKTAKELLTYINSNYRLFSSSAISTLWTGGSEVSGFALAFNKTAAVTKQIHYGEGFSMFNRNFSLSMYFKPNSVGGILMSNGQTKTFAVLNTDPLSLQCEETIVQSIASPYINQWNQLILSFFENTNELHLYHYGPNSTITYQILKFSCPNIVMEGGMSTLGEWTPSTNGKKYVFDKKHFDGIIEEISIWKEPLDAPVIFQAQNLNVRVSGFANNVSSLIQFSAGVGQIAFDVISGNNFYLPLSPWQSPEWIPSDLGLKVISTEIDVSVSILQSARKICAEFFGSSVVISKCKGQSLEESLWWFKQKCIQVASEFGNINYGFVPMASYIQVCGATGENITELFNEICAMNATVPYWIKQQCHPCHFGFWSNNSCVCNYGYYGHDCKNECPNGFSAPCSKKGICDRSGKCRCHGHWNGTKCETCSTGWTGEDCSYLKSGQTTSAIMVVAQANTIGQVITFDGVTFDIVINNVYKLFVDTRMNLSILGYFSSCESLSNGYLCLNGISIEKDGEYFAVKVDSFQQKKVSVKTFGSTFSVFTNTQKGTLQFSLATSTRLEVTFTDTMCIKLKISMISKRLFLTITLDQSTWLSHTSSIDGLLASCNTTEAISTSLCGISRHDLCALSYDKTTCNSTLSTSNLALYVAGYKVRNEKINQFLDNATVVSSSACLYFVSNSMYVKNLILPQTDVTFEVYVKPKAFGGAIMSYHVSVNSFVLVNLNEGLVLLVGGQTISASLNLELNKWNQISLAWKTSLSVLEIYVISSSGISVVEAFKLPSATFSSDGTLSLGEVGTGITVNINIGHFHGYIDEVRIWERSHNPTIIILNQRLKVSTNTPGLSAAWSFNDGVGFMAVEMKKNQNMYAKDIDIPPTWAESDLYLTEDVSFMLPDFTIAESDATVSTDNCNTLLQDPSFVSVCSGLGNMIKSTTDQCKVLVTSTGDKTISEVIALSTAEYCQEVKNLSSSPAEKLCNSIKIIDDFLTSYGTNCEETCVFGTVTNGTCVCDMGYWGANCNMPCPLAKYGICNGQGLCKDGKCICKPHFLSESVTFKEYLEKYNTSSTVSGKSGNCSECTKGWNGNDCNVAVETASTSESNRFGLIFGSYVVTLDGASYNLNSPGLFEVLNLSDITVQILFWPCPGNIDCREVQEISFNDISILRSGGEMKLLVSSANVKFPVTSSSGKVLYHWIVKDYIRLTVGSSSALISGSDIGLICRFKVNANDASSNQGLLGNTDGVWWKDLLSVEDKLEDNSTIAESKISRPYIGYVYSESDISTYIKHPQYDSNLTTAGYIVRITNQTLKFTGMHLASDVAELTMSFWIRVEKHLTSRHVLISLDTGNYILEIILQNGIVTISWEEEYITENVIITANTWTYFTLAWQSTNGELILYLMTNGLFTYETFYSVHVGSALSLDELKIDSNMESFVDIDHFRAWRVYKTITETIIDMEYYRSSELNTTGLMLLAQFDEGQGAETLMVKYTSYGTNKIIGSIAGTIADDTWLPSNIPLKKSFVSTNPQLTDDKGAINKCTEALNTFEVRKYYRKLENLEGFLLEACMTEFSKLSNVTTNETIILNLIFYYEAVFSVSECDLKGYFDYCMSDTSRSKETPIVLIIVIILVIILIIITMMYCCCGWKKVLSKSKTLGNARDKYKQKNFYSSQEYIDIGRKSEAEYERSQRLSERSVDSRANTQFPFSPGIRESRTSSTSNRFDAIEFSNSDGSIQTTSFIHHQTNLPTAQKRTYSQSK